MPDNLCRMVKDTSPQVLLFLDDCRVANEVSLKSLHLALNIDGVPSSQILFSSPECDDCEHGSDDDNDYPCIVRQLKERLDRCKIECRNEIAQLESSLAQYDAVELLSIQFESVLPEVEADSAEVGGNFMNAFNIQVNSTGSSEA